MAEADGEEPAKHYKAKPPTWLAQIHRTADLGYLGFHPPRPNQEEDQLTDKFVRDGFSSNSTISAETYSALKLAKEELTAASLLPHVEEVVNRVYARRTESASQVPPSSFKLPGRATVNDSRRSAWVNDLADPDIPLQKLGRSVPSGFKGHDLLEMLQHNNITIPRAVWYIRVLGGNETQGMRNRPNFNPVQYSIEWANNITSYLKKLLSDIVLPSPPRAGLNIKQSFKSNFIEQEPRDKWISRCSYYLDLLRACYCEGLVDQYSFLSWLSQQCSPGVSSLPQLSLICRIAEEYLDGIARYRQFSRPFIYNCLVRLTELQSNYLADYISSTTSTLKLLITQLFVMCPDSFVCAQTWKLYSEVLYQVIVKPLVGDEAPDQSSPLNVLGAKSADFVLALYRDVEMRSDAILMRSLPQRSNSVMQSKIASIQILNRTSRFVEPSAVVYFEDDGSFEEKLDILLTWAVTPLQYGDHRIYVAASLLSIWREDNEADLSRNGNAREILQDLLFDWLESSVTAEAYQNTSNVAVLFGELIRKDCFSYYKYIQRLIARCEVLGLSQDDRTCHSEFLKNIPLSIADTALVKQRKIILYGHRARETPEDEVERSIRTEISGALPYFFGGEGEMSCASVESQFPTLLGCSTHTQVHILRSWVFPSAYRTVKKTFDPLGAKVEAYSILFEVVAATKCFPIMFDMIIMLFEHAVTRPLLDLLIDITSRFSDIWVAMDVKEKLADAISLAIPTWRARNVDIRPVIQFLQQIDLLQHMSLVASGQIEEYMTSLIQSLRPLIINAPPMPPRLPEVLLLAQDIVSNAPELLATSLWIKYRSSPNLAWILWDNTFASIRQIPSLFLNDDQGQYGCSIKYANFLDEVHNRVPGDFDKQVLDWFNGTGFIELKALGPDIWEPFVVVLIELLARGVLRSATILIGVLCPVWRMATDGHFVNASDASKVLQAINQLTWRILLCTVDGDLPPLCLREFQHLASERECILHGEALKNIIDCLPSMVKLEHNTQLPSPIRTSMSKFRLQFTNADYFRHAVSRNLEDFGATFTMALARDGTDPTLKKHISTAGKVVLNEFYGERKSADDSSEDAQCDPHRVALHRSPWRFSRTAIEIQLTMHEYSSEECSVESDGCLDRFVASFFCPMSSEENDMVANVAGGAVGSLRVKFLTAGLKRLTDLLNNVEMCDSSVEQFIAAGSGILRMLSKVTTPWKEVPLGYPTNDLKVQEDFFSIFSSKFQTALTLLMKSTGEETQLSRDEIRRLTTFMSRVLQFNLGFSATWSPDLRRTLTALHSSLLQATIDVAGGPHMDSELFVVLLDTLAYLTDELPYHESRSPSDGAHPDFVFDPKDLPSWIPGFHSKRLLHLICFTPDDHFVERMAQVSQESGESATHGFPIQARPWEWLDHCEIQTEGQDSNQLRNATSVALEHFDASATDDHVTTKSEIDFRSAGAIASFRDAFHTETLFERDWRETRVGFQDATLSLDVQERPSTSLEDKEGDRSSIHSSLSRLRESPAPSSLSRSSGRGSSGSWKQSPSTLSHSVNEIIDVDNIPSTSSSRAGKRKLSSQLEEVVLVDGPTKRTRASKTTKAKTKKK